MVPNRTLAVALTAFAVLFAAAAAAQTYPAKPVRLIVTYPPGGSSDLMARVFGLKLGELWSQQVLVESKGGAAGAIGMEYAARQTPDGYSFVVGNLGPTAVNPLLSKVPYSVERDFVPVSLISTGPNILVVNANSPFKSLGDILAYARANPGKLNYGTSGPGSVSHLGAELFKSLTKANVVEVPYKGSILAIQDLLGGQIQFIFSDALPALGQIRAGKLRALAVTSPERSPLVPDLPTCVEAGVPGLVAVNWWGVLMPAGTPKPIIDKFHGDLVKTMADPEVKRKFGDLGVDAVSTSPEQFAAFIKSETAKYEKLIKEAGIKVN
jgi:tripartite-type tricarboxylate transporter receptor subunit TctC